MVRILLCAILLFIDCAGGYQGNGVVTIELNFPPEQSPLDGAQNITLSIWWGNELISTQDFPLDSRVGISEDIPYNIPVYAIVEAKNKDGATISKGRTPEFILEKNKKKPIKIFFSRIGTFSKLKNDMNARIAPGVALIQDNLVLVAGGRSPSGDYLDSSEVYSHDGLSFEVTGSMNQSKAGHSMARLKNRNIVVIGGQDKTSLTPDIEIFDLENRQFKTISRLNSPRKNASSTVMDNGIVLICGGSGETSGLNTCEAFNPETTTVELLEAKMNNFRYNHSALLLPDGNILLAGGNGFNSVEIFNIANGSFLLPSLLSSERENSYIEYTGADTIIIACGVKPASVDILKLPDFSISTPEGSPVLPAECSAHIMLDGKLFVAGGIEDNLPSDSAMIIDMKTYQIEWSGRMLTRRRAPAIEMLSDGTLLILGGTDTPPYVEIFNPP